MHFKHKWHYESPVSRICVKCRKMQTMDAFTECWHTKSNFTLWKERSEAQLSSYNNLKFHEKLEAQHKIEEKKEFEKYLKNIVGER